MTTGDKIEYLQEKILKEESQKNFNAVIALSHEILGLLGDGNSHLRTAAFQWDLVARMHLHLNEFVKAEMAAKKSLETYLHYRKEVGGNWTPERDSYFADFRMTMALSLAYQKRYAEAMPYAEQWEQTHLKVRGPDDPFVKDVVVRHMKRMRARLAGLPVSENDWNEHAAK